jgi:hypothetical protein
MENYTIIEEKNIYIQKRFWNIKKFLKWALAGLITGLILAALIFLTTYENIIAEAIIAGLASFGPAATIIAFDKKNTEKIAYKIYKINVTKLTMEEIANIVEHGMTPIPGTTEIENDKITLWIKPLSTALRDEE